VTQLDSGGHTRAEHEEHGEAGQRANGIHRFRSPPQSVPSYLPFPPKIVPAPATVTFPEARRRIE